MPTRMLFSTFGYPRWRRPLRNIAIGGVVAVAAVFALMGAFLVLVVLAAGAIVHALVSAMRQPAVGAARPSHSDGKIIEGEYVVLSGPRADRRPVNAK
jgi:hypothetical protein